jgi:hypothetical protein
MVILGPELHRVRSAARVYHGRTMLLPRPSSEKERKGKEKPCTYGPIRCFEASAAYVQAGEAARAERCHGPRGEEDGATPAGGGR